MTDLDTLRYKLKTAEIAGMSYVTRLTPDECSGLIYLIDGMERMIDSAETFRIAKANTEHRRREFEKLSARRDWFTMCAVLALTAYNLLGDLMRLILGAL